MTETESSFEAAIKREGLKKGIWLGLVLLALNIFAYYFITAITKDPITIFFGMGLFGFILPLAFSVVFSILMRQQLGGYWSFRHAVRGIFIMFLVSYGILIIGRDGIFGNFIEPNMAAKTTTAMQNSERARYKQQGLNDAQIKAKLADNEKQFGATGKATVFTYIQSYIITIILLFVLALGLALILKRELAQVAT